MGISKKTLITFGLIVIIAVTTVFLSVVVYGMKGYSQNHGFLQRAEAGERFSLEKNEQSENLSEAFLLNQNEANVISQRFIEFLGKTYGTTVNDSVYTVNGLRAESYPAYFGGFYINTDGYLVVQIKDSYYTPDYRNSSWYQEFSGIVGSERFYCHPVKYSYSELINAISDISLGDLSKELSERGIRPVLCGIDDYKNTVDIYLGSQEDYDHAINALSSEIYYVSVIEEKLQLHVSVEQDRDPEDLDSMSTEQVLEFCLEYPNMLDLLAFDHYSDAIKTFIVRDNRFLELSKRDDAPGVVMQALKDYHQTVFDPQNHEEEFRNFYGKENFYFAMVRYFFEEGTISEQDFKDAERIHYQHLNEHNVFEGKEKIPYGDDLVIVY